MLALRSAPENLRYGAMFAAHFALIGAQLPFFSGFLEDRGFSAVAIGAIGAASLLFRMLAGPAIAYRVDSRGAQRSAIAFWAFAVALPATCLPFFSGAMLGAASLAMLCAFGALTPLIDAGALGADRRGALHYGQTRACGSAAFIASAILTGAVVERAGIAAAVIVMAASAAAAFAFSFTLPDTQSASAGAISPAERRAEAGRLVRSRTFLLFLAAAGLGQGAHAGYYYFTILDWRAQGMDARAIGLLWATGTFCEIFILARGRALARRFGPVGLIAAGGAASVLRWTATAFAPPLPILFLVQALHALTFGAAFLGAVEFIARATPERLGNTAITLMSSTGVGLATAAAAFAGGLLYQWGGPAPMYALMAGCGAASALCAWALSRAWVAGERIV
ncbi:MAG: MFS transporter [Xanthomonadaceae bacterium]|nr:MFS transporter [Xanthomonadaceae bacterium]